MQGYVKVDEVNVMLRQWVGAKKPYLGSGTGPSIRKRVAKWAAKQAVWQGKNVYQMGYIGGRWVPISVVDEDCQWYCIADDSWHGVNVWVTFYRRIG